MRYRPDRFSIRRRGIRRAGLSLCALVAIPLAGCFPEEQSSQSAARDAGAMLPARDRVDRTHKADRLAVNHPVAPSRPAARMAAMPQTRHSVPLSAFYRALGQLKSGLREEPVTVLHLGDSHIAADRFSGDLRTLFQARFGDAGRGMMMPGYPFPYYRARGVTFEKEGDWQAANSFKGDPGPYGLTGVRLTARDDGARLALDVDDGVAEWAEVAFLRQPDGGDAVVAFGGVRRSVSTASAGHDVVRIRIDSKGRELSVTTRGPAPVTLLSWAVGQNRPGIRYVNFGIPGATADTPRRWDDNLVLKGLGNLRPDLIVLGYGTNEGFNDSLDTPAYARRVGELVSRLKQGAPQASLLVIGPPDGARLPKFARRSTAAQERCGVLGEGEQEMYAQLKASKSEKLARWHAPPSLSRVRASLQEVAETSNAHFWDWSKVMGGPCGIHQWANAEPPLAASDHVHLRSAGARRSARVLFKELMAGFEAHVRLASRQ